MIKRSDFNLFSFIIFHFKTWFAPIFFALVVLLFRLHPFDPAPFPAHQVSDKTPVIAPRVNNRMLQIADFIGSGRVIGPEDMAYDSRSGILYTGCEDGWIKRVKVEGLSGSELVVEDWVNTGGRPLGIAIGDDALIVADAYKGLLKIAMNREVKVLSDEAEGQKFKLTDGVDIAKDGTIYFTDASYKYDLQNYVHDHLECRPHGRLLSFNPHSGITKVLLKDLYFPNGVALSPDQNSLIFCETRMKRCRKYWIQGSKKGSVDGFIDNLPGFPDNIHSDGQNMYWIGIPSMLNPYLEHANTYRIVRKAMSMMDKYISLHHIQKNGGILGVDLQGNPTVHLYDPALSLITSVIQVLDHLYIGSLHDSRIIRLNMTYVI
ncbi:unnamed protein product [Amaranthus hypochondriacus]